MSNYSILSEVETNVCPSVRKVENHSTLSYELKSFISFKSNYFRFNLNDMQKHLYIYKGNFSTNVGCYTM